MSNRKFIIPIIALAAALGGAGAATLPAQHAAAQTASPAPAPPPARPNRPPQARASHIEGHIAYLKAELKITPTQEAQFDKVAQALRQSADERRRDFEQVRVDRTQPPNALQALEMQARFSATRAQQTDRFLAAFRPLYDSLSPEQKKSADEIMTPHHHFGRHRI